MHFSFFVVFAFFLPDLYFNETLVLTVMDDLCHDYFPQSFRFVIWHIIVDISADSASDLRIPHH